MSCQVVFSREAVEDLERLFDHILEHEIGSATGDWDIHARAIAVIQHACQRLAHSPVQ